MISSVEGLAFDWISKMLYFVDGVLAKIEVIRTDIHHSGRMRKTLLDKAILRKPRGIALDPVAGFVVLIRFYLIYFLIILHFLVLLL